MALHRKHYTALTILNVLAILVTSYLTFLHFKPELSDICHFNDQWNCDVVNKSIYSEIFGIPVAILGLLAYLAFLIFSVRGIFVDQKKLLPYFLLAVSGATVFALYLTGIETFVLKTYCLFCVVQQIIILAELGVTVHLYKLTTRRSRVNYEKTSKYETFSVSADFVTHPADSLRTRHH